MSTGASLGAGGLFGIGGGIESGLGVGRVSTSGTEKSCGFGLLGFAAGFFAITLGAGGSGSGCGSGNGVGSAITGAVCGKGLNSLRWWLIAESGSSLAWG